MHCWIVGLETSYAGDPTLCILHSSKKHIPVLIPWRAANAILVKVILLMPDTDLDRFCNMISWRDKHCTICQ